jgi:hypothetical protein
MIATIAGVFALVALSTGVASAHNSYRLIGTITKVGPKRLELKQTKDGRRISVDIADTTTLSRDKKKITVAELKVGQDVAVDATGDSLQFLVATQIRIVPAPAKK